MKYIITLLFFITQSLVLFSQDKETVLAEVEVMFNEGKIAEAKVELEGYLVIDSTCFECHANLAMLYSNKDDLDKSMYHLNKALEIEKRGFLHFMRADLYYYLEDMDAFCEDVSEGLVIYEEVHKRGDLKEEDIKKMESYQYQKGDVCDDATIGYYLHRGLAAWNKGDTIEIIEHYNAGLEKFPNNVVLRNYRGNYYLRLLSDYEKAEADYRFVLKNEDELKKYVLANQSYENENDWKMFLSETQMGLSTALMHQGELDESLKIMEEVLKDVPEDPRYNITISNQLNVYGGILIGLGQYEKAKEIFHQSLKKDKDNSESYRNIALTILLEQTMLSELEINRVSQFSLGVKSSNIQLGKMKSTKKGKVSTSELETALYLINKAIKMHENAADYYCIRGDIKKMLGMQDYCLDYHSSFRLGNTALEEFIKEICK